MEENALLLDRIRSFTAKELGCKLYKISIDTRLRWDLGMVGDDAVEFFEAFAREFEIPLESLQGLDMRKHFGDESDFYEGGLITGLFLLVVVSPMFFFGLWPWIVIMPLLACVAVYACSRKAEIKYGRAPDVIRVKHLVEAAEARAWTMK